MYEYSKKKNYMYSLQKKAMVQVRPADTNTLSVTRGCLWTSREEEKRIHKNNLHDDVCSSMV